MRGVILGGALALCGLGAAHAEKTTQPAGSADWSPERATGPRDVRALGDSVNAWATGTADAGAEWLRLGYAEPMLVKEIRIWQNNAPGAVVRVTVTVSGQEIEVWAGRDTVKAATAPVEKVLSLPKPYLTDTVTVHLDTAWVSGWNEIDAVQVVAADGRRAWAETATASSTYATSAPAHPLSHLVGKAVAIRVEGAVVEGTVMAVDSTWVTLRTEGKTTLVSQTHAAAIEWRE